MNVACNNNDAMESAITFDLNEFLLSVSFALDFAEIDILGATSNHSKRVALIAMKLGRYFNLSEEELFDLCSFAVLHDNGIVEEKLYSKLTILPEEKGKIQGLEKYKEHCEYGERNIADFPFRTKHKNIIKYHHEKYDGTGFYGVKGNDIPILAQLIALADTVDNLFHFEREQQENRDEIVRFVKEGKRTWFAPELVEAFEDLSSRPGFWLDLQNQFITEVVHTYVPGIITPITWREVSNIASVFSSIIDSKSRFTYSHSSGLSDKVVTMADYYKIEGDNGCKLKIAAELHDLGKLGVPNELLNKPAKLTDKEFDIIRTHAYYTRRGLERISLFSDIAEWASNHHERLDGSGYPYGKENKELYFNDRLMICLDVYQALTEERPYRGQMSHKKAVQILERQSSAGKLDGDITADIKKLFSD